MVSDFHKRKQLKSGLTSWCKVCMAKSKKVYQTTKDGLITRIYSHQKDCCKQRGHPLPTYSKAELKEWVFSQDNFDELYNAWVESGCNRDLNPSVDRIDDYKSYSFDNIQLLTFKENREKSCLDRKKGRHTTSKMRVIEQYTKEGKLVSTYHSQCEAARQSGLNQGNIGSCCRGERNQAGGYIWRFASQTSSKCVEVKNG